MYRWLTPESELFLKRDYLLPNVSVDERVTQICDYAERLLGIPGFSKKLKTYIVLGYLSLSSPIWSNFGLDRGLPISCFGSYVEDSVESILDVSSEIGVMSKYGGGTSVYCGEIRPRGSDIKNNGKTSGSVHFMQLFETVVNTISQGSSRRGSCAVYLDIDHKDIEEFLDIKSEGNPIQHLSFGVCVSNKWLSDMENGDSKKREIWAKVLRTRQKTGYPYIFFTDNANDNKPQVYKDKQLNIKHSNLCSEIMLPDNKKWSFVCDLSSANILYYDEWKDSDLIETIVYFLDAVMTDFINTASKIKHLEKAVEFAKTNRALGIGWVGYHSYLQSKMIPFESLQAKSLNTQIAKTIYEQSQAASRKLAKEYGEPELLKGYGLRNTTTCAIAPTKSSAFILGQVSESIEPNHSNYFIKDLQKGKFTIKNKYLEALLESKGYNTLEVWDSILKNAGSVQHLTILTEKEKDVFKTFAEISPMEIIIQASSRQKYIDQGQSLNIMIHPSIPVKDVNKLILYAWKNGIKALYYQISVNAAQEFARNINVCKSCES